MASITICPVVPPLHLVFPIVLKVDFHKLGLLPAGLLVVPREEVPAEPTLGNFRDDENEPGLYDIVPSSLAGHCYTHTLHEVKQHRLGKPPYGGAFPDSCLLRTLRSVECQDVTLYHYNGAGQTCPAGESLSSSMIELALGLPAKLP